MAEFEDKELTCVEPGCGATFIFEAGEQAFFAEKGFTPPKRCKPCRQRKKAEKQSRDNDRAVEVDYSQTWEDNTKPEGRGGRRGRRR